MTPHRERQILLLMDAIIIAGVAAILVFILLHILKVIV
jgi:hypothetical protein